MIKTILVATAALAVGVAAASAADAPDGDYCLSASVQNGHDPITGKYIPRTMIYRRGADCPEEDQVTIRLEDGQLKIEGDGLDLTFSIGKENER
jgi:hypothetical protein